jgi:hypothetical protein
MPAPELCDRCRKVLQPYDTISVADVGVRCYPCFNEEASARMGVDFDHTFLQPVTVNDGAGVEHTFEFRSMLAATGHALYAREAVPAGREGYEFAVLGDFEAKVWDLFRILYERIRRSLAIRHVERGELGWQITNAHRLVGRICWDPDRGGEVPLLVVDGRPYTWDEIGRMLMSFEGFTLRAEIQDRIEVVGGPLLDEDEP